MMTEAEQVNLIELCGDVREMKGVLQGMTDVLGAHTREMCAMRAQMAAVASAYQNHNLELAEIRRQCAERHRHDTDETERAHGLEARVRVVENDLCQLQPRFDVAETSVVEARTEAATMARVRADAARRWQIIAAIATVAGTLGGMGIFKLLMGG